MNARFLALPLLLCCCAAGPSVTLLRDTVVDPRGIYFTEGGWGNTLNGRSFQQEALASHNGWQYTTYFDGERRLCVARRKLSDASWQRIVFDDYRFKGKDSHNAPVLGICAADGTIHLSFDHHGHPLHYRVSKKGAATQPQEVTWNAALFGPVIDELETGRKVARVTYPRFIATPDGALQFQCRIGGSGNGASWLADYEGGTWKNFAAFVDGAGTFGEHHERNAYENGYTYDQRGRLHVTWCWRETGGPMTNHDICYAFSDDGGVTWKNNSGAVIGQRNHRPRHLSATASAPGLINIDSTGVRVWEIPMGRGLMNSTTQAVDRDGNLHVLTRHVPDAAPAPADWNAAVQASRFVHYHRDADGKWRQIETSFTGERGQMCFDAANNAYLVFCNQGLQIAAADAAKQWKDWRIIHGDPRPFIEQPLIDVGRVASENVLSIYVQQRPAQESETGAPLHVLDFQLAR